MLAKLSTRPAVRRCAGSGVLALALLGAGLPAAGAAEPPEPDLTRFYRQKVTWSACTGRAAPKDMQCGKVTVPLDYARPGAGTIDIALARYRATGKSQGSVLLNFGGPGGPGISTLAAAGKDYMGLTNGYDVVTFDPRGVGRSSPVSCGEGGDEDSSQTAEVTPDASDPQAILELLQKAAALCAAHSGPVLPHIGTVNASRDLDVIRQALGDKKLNYLGFSYGTRLGAVYAAQFPGKVGRMVLDGVDTLTEPLSEQGLASAAGQQTALDGFLDWCVQDVGCPFGQDRRKAGEQVVQLVHSLDANPVPKNVGGEFSDQDLVGAIGQGLYSQEMWPSLERALAMLMEDGDTSKVAAFASGGMAPWRAGGGLVNEEDVPVDNLTAALMAINCADDPDRLDAGQIKKEIGRLRADYERASPVFGRHRLSEVLMCYGRPKGTDFIRDRVKDLHSAKILLVGTRGDPATPYRWAEETAKRLGPSAVVLDNKGEGHTGYMSSKCVHRKVDDFLLYGSLPANGSSCGPDGSHWDSVAKSTRG
ncbi:alpha/beta hydrolase [Streptomyces brasiliensis]|uniref:Protease n=1 Tax=Streptomyces brasiliensis TaxID=1954 RepID=A0A917KXY4_9ACTN|nr:alpha/beta hydrolase [Streptomyces brasiliensis]GGJ30225.1 protease [Streptomyces brasiliensis]